MEYPGQHPSRTAAGTVSPALLVAVLVTSGCVWGVEDVAAAPPAEVPASPVAAMIAANASLRDDAADHGWNAADVVPVTLSGTTAISPGPTVSVDGGTVTIGAAGTYELSGSLTDGRIVVDTPDPQIVRLVLHGADVTSSTGPAVLVTKAGRVLVSLGGTTANHLTSLAGSAAVDTSADLAVDGSGSLAVDSRSGDGVRGTRGVAITSGTVTVTGAGDGVVARDYVAVTAGSVTVTCPGRGLASGNDEDPALGYVLLSGGTASVISGGDGVSAATDVIVAGSALTVRSGTPAEPDTGRGARARPATGGGTGAGGPGAEEPETVKGLRGDVNVAVGSGSLAVDTSGDALHSAGTVTVGGGTVEASADGDGLTGATAVVITDGVTTVHRCEEGIEAPQITISGGTTSVTSTDDGVNGSDGSGSDLPTPAVHVVISGGVLVVDSAADGLDSNGSLEISGGTVVVSGAQTGDDGALDANGSLRLLGGTLIASGIYGIAGMRPAKGGQAWLSYTFPSVQQAGTILHLTTGSGAQIAAFAPPKKFRGIVVSTDRVTAGQSYDLLRGGTVSGSPTGWSYPGGSTLDAVRVATVRVNALTWPPVFPTPSASPTPSAG
jgi:hypothetical protein